MIFGEFLARVKRQVSRTDIGDDEYEDYCQRALKKIQQRRSWSVMKQSTAIIMQGGLTFINLPGNFKELQSGDAPIRTIYSGNQGNARAYPCIIQPKREQERLYSEFAYGTLNSYFRCQIQRLPVYLDQSAEVWTVNIWVQAWQDITFLVDYYGFLETPENPDDTNFFLNNYEEMCMAKAKAICWESVNDEIAAEQESLFDKEFKESAYEDAYRQTRGVEMRM